MVICKRCETICLKKDNYCSYCGAPVKLEILKMVQDAFEQRRKQSVHAMLNVLVKEGCINKEKLDALLEKLDKVFNSKASEPPATSDQPQAEEKNKHKIDG